jgi:enoyl-CoA hydratase/carnithine racemase
VLTGETYEPTRAAELGIVDAVVAEADLLDTATAIARRLTDTIPADTYRHTKEQLHREAEERIARWTPDGDLAAVQLWCAGVEDGRIARFMTETVGRAR